MDTDVHEWLICLKLFSDFQLQLLQLCIILLYIPCWLIFCQIRISVED